MFNYTNPDRPFQLTEVISENRPAQFRTNQTVAYTSFQRPSMIHHGDYTAFFTYNASGDRVRMQTEHITKGGELQDRFYIGSRFEVDVIEHSAILWLGGDAYSAPAALKRQFGGTWKIYYICRDYLGSIHVVTDADGVIVQEISFDPWGRLRNAQTHQLYAIGHEPRLFLGNRGFTGHEHLQWFGLINMNARLYDPLVGRFLSPDPFVQAPSFTQSFNRYSYVWNNPLRWVDPTGMIVTRPGSTNKQWWEDDDDWWNDNVDTWGDTTVFGDVTITGSRHGTSGWWSDFWSWKSARSAGSFGISAWSNFNEGRQTLARLEHAVKGAFSLQTGQTAAALKKIKAVGLRLDFAGAGFIIADIAISQELRPSHIIDGLAIGATRLGPYGVLAAGLWFATDYTTMGVNLILGNGAVGMGNVIDNRFGPIRTW